MLGVINKSNFKWDLSANFSTHFGEVVSLVNGQDITTAYVIREGRVLPCYLWIYLSGVNRPMVIQYMKLLIKMLMETS